MEQLSNIENEIWKFDETDETHDNFESLYLQKKQIYQELLNLTGHDFGEESTEELNDYYNKVDDDMRHKVEDLIHMIRVIRKKQIELLDFKSNEDNARNYSDALIDESGKLGFGGVQDRSYSSIIQDVINDRGEQDKWQIIFN